MINNNTNENEGKTGIYKITNKTNGKCYIGQSKNLRARKLEHLRDLKRNSHVNWHLQRAYNKYGIEAFDFTIAEYCDVRELTDKENHYIDKFNSLDKHKGYNLKVAKEKVAYSKLTLEKMSRSQRKLKGSKKMRRKMAWYRSELTEAEVKKIKRMLYSDVPVQDIAERLDVTYNQVRHIKDNNSFTFVLPEYNYYIKYREQIQRRRTIKTVLRMYRAGKSFDEIGRAIDKHPVTPYRIAEKYKNKHDERCRQNSIDYLKKKEKISIKTLSSMGYSGAKIVRTLGVSKAIVYRVLNERRKSSVGNSPTDMKENPC